MKSVFLTCLLATAVQAEWLCTQESSQRFGNDISACGIGEAKLEGDARTLALENAKSEFNRICSASDDCRGHKVVLDPRRTDCKPTAVGMKCYRLVRFSIASELSDLKPISAPTIKKIDTAKNRSLRKSHKSTLTFDPIRRGMTKSELLANFGVPHSIDDLGVRGRQHFKRMNYEGKYCVYFSCSATLGAKWVTAYSDFKPQYTAQIASVRAKRSSVLEDGVDVWDVSGEKAIKTQIPSEDVTDGVAVGIYSFSVGEKVPVFSPAGESLTLASAEVQQAFQIGYIFRKQPKIGTETHGFSRRLVNSSPDQTITGCGLIYGASDNKKGVPCSSGQAAEVHFGERFDFHLKVRSTARNQLVRLELSGPQSVESFYPRDVDRVSFSNDKKSFVAERGLFFDSDGNGSLAYGWPVGNGDPIGNYKLRAFLGDVLVGAFSINISPLVRSVSSVSNNRPSSVGLFIFLVIVLIVGLGIWHSKTLQTASSNGIFESQPDTSSGAEPSVEWLFHCKNLGTTPSSSQEEIRKAYLAAAKKYHPDKHGNHPLANAKFQEIQDSYNFLMEASTGIVAPHERQKNTGPSSANPKAVEVTSFRSRFVQALILIPLVGSTLVAVYNAFTLQGSEGQRTLFLVLGAALATIFGLPWLFARLRRIRMIRSLVLAVALVFILTLGSLAIFWFVGAIASVPAWAAAVLVVCLLVRSVR